MKKIWAIFSAIALGIIAVLLGRRRSQKPDPVRGYPKNKSSKAAAEDIQESFQEEVDRVKTATTSDTPADDLADLGNARKRR